MMSHLDPQKGSTAAPCLRSKRNPPEEVSFKSKYGHLLLKSDEIILLCRLEKPLG